MVQRGFEASIIPHGIETVFKTFNYEWLGVSSSILTADLGFLFQVADLEGQLAENAEEIQRLVATVAEQQAEIVRLQAASNIDEVIEADGRAAVSVDREFSFVATPGGSNGRPNDPSGAAEVGSQALKNIKSQALKKQTPKT